MSPSIWRCRIKVGAGEVDRRGLGPGLVRDLDDARRLRDGEAEHHGVARAAVHLLGDRPDSRQRVRPREQAVAALERRHVLRQLEARIDLLQAELLRLGGRLRGEAREARVARPVVEDRRGGRRPSGAGDGARLRRTRHAARGPGLDRGGSRGLDRGGPGLLRRRGEAEVPDGPREVADGVVPARRRASPPLAQDANHVDEQPVSREPPDHVVEDPGRALLHRKVLRPHAARERREVSSDLLAVRLPEGPRDPPDESLALRARPAPPPFRGRRDLVGPGRARSRRGHGLSRRLRVCGGPDALGIARVAGAAHAHRCSPVEGLRLRPPHSTTEAEGLLTSCARSARGGRASGPCRPSRRAAARARRRSASGP